MLNPPLQLFVAYAREDRQYLDALVKHLAPLRHELQIHIWHDGDIHPGEDWDKTIRTSLSSAHVIVALISASFIASYHCYNVELEAAFERHQAGTALLIPIIVRSCSWRNLPLGKLQALPKNAKPLHDWPTEDSFWTDVADGIRRTCIRLLPERPSRVADAIRPHVPSKSAPPRRIPLVAAGSTLGALLIVLGLRTLSSARSACPASMVYIEGGTFRMGSEDYDKEAAGDERPAHDVTLSPFCIDVREVTVERYRECSAKEKNGMKCPPAPVIQQMDQTDLKFWYRFCNRDGLGRDDHPINCIDWATAAAYCKWAGGGLPTEAQWEYTAKGSEPRRFPWGSAPPGARMLNACGAECRDMAAGHHKTLPAMYGDNDGAETTAPVGSYPDGATPDGVLDMAGNVSEWVRDTKAGYESTLPKDPVRTAGQLHVLRGGSWYSSTSRAVRTTARESLENGYYLNVVGFRCVREVDR